MTIISANRQTAYAYDHAAQVTIVQTGVALAVEQAYAVTDKPGAAAAFNGCMLGNFGAIYSDYSAVVMFGVGALVVNHASGSIVGAEGVYLSGSEGFVDNQGYIYGASNGVHLAGDGSLNNSGTITSNVRGVLLGGNFTNEVYNSGLISGRSFAISSDGTATISIVNSGLITGDIVLTDGGRCVIRNSGVIDGYISMSVWGDSYDGRGGAVDLVYAYDGADTIRGGSGDDVFNGGGGADVLKGGGGADTFEYSYLSDSAGKAVDVIRGWDAQDEFDLSDIDAAPGKPGTQHLTYGGMINATDPVGNDQVQWYRKGGDTFVVADVNGDGKAEMTIRLAGSYTLDAGDFILG